MPDLSAQIVVRSTLSLCKKIRIYIFVGLALENTEPKKFNAPFRINYSQTTSSLVGGILLSQKPLNVEGFQKLKQKREEF
jgi:hypothetical protein